MTHDVFLSYKREDERHAARLAKALESAGFSLWWDRSLLPAENWRSQIQGALDQARCVVVIWTRESVGPAGDFVRDEAGQAKARGRLVPVVMEKTRLPLGFAELQAIDLVGWNGSTSSAFFRDLVAACRAKIDGKAPPRSKGPLQRTLRRAYAGFASVAGLMGMVAFAADFMSVQAQACSMPIGQPGLSDICGSLGLGNKPTREERLAFDALSPGDCSQLQAFRDQFESSPLRSIVDSRLADRRMSVTDVWTPQIRELPLSVDSPHDRSTDETAAKVAALDAATSDADRLCKGLTSGSLFRLSTTSVRADSWKCEEAATGIACRFSGWAVCNVEARSQTESATCGSAL